MGNTVFFGGVPTQKDIKALAQRFADIDVGDEISHADIESCTGLSRKESRYQTVVAAWRKMLLNEKNIELGAVPGVGFRVLNNSERVSVGIDGIQKGARKQLRSIKKAVMVCTTDPALLKKQELMSRLGVAVQGEVSAMMRQVEPPKPFGALPRPMAA
jgi:hypothetical protein